MRYTLLSADHADHIQLHIQFDALHVIVHDKLQWFGLAIC
jgi:hypothetical protein